jgi:transcriptional antiterminator NusG
MMMALTESSPPTLDEDSSAEESALASLPEEEAFDLDADLEADTDADLDTDTDADADADLDNLDHPAPDRLEVRGEASAAALPANVLADAAMAADDHVTGAPPTSEGAAGGEGGEKPQVARWYAVQVASSCEKKVKATLEQRAITLGVSSRILDIEIPQTPGVKLKKDGTRQSIEEKVFPGYVLVRMILDEDTMMAVRSTPNVINFVGQEERRATGKTRGHIKPRPLSRSEVERIFRRATEKKAVIKVDLSEGDQILVTGGPFKDFQGEVIEVSAERSKLKALLSIFGRETPVELEFSQVSKQN